MRATPLGFALAVTAAGAMAQNNLPEGVSKDLFEEAERMVQSSQGPSAAPSDWNLQRNARRQADTLTRPVGEWPLEELGVPEPKDDPYNLYILVTEELPEPLIRAYAFDALQTGATLVIRGINPDEKVQDAMVRWGTRVTREDGAAPSVEIEPRVFSAFDVETAPAIVLSTKPIEDLCNMTESEFSVGHETAGNLGTLPYKTCAPAPEDTYYKMTGSISVPWALKRMSETDAVPLLQQTAKNWFKVLPERYGLSPGEFGWAAPMSEEQYAKTSDEEAVRRHLEQVKANNPNLELVETELGWGLGEKKPSRPQDDSVDR